MAIFIGLEGSGKGIILAHLLLPLFDKCGLHCNFDAVTDRFNAVMEHKVFVLVDEGSKSLYFQSVLVAEGSYGTHALFTYTQLHIAPLPFSQRLQLCLHHLCCLHVVADANDL